MLRVRRGGEGALLMGDALGHLIPSGPILPRDGSRKVFATSLAAPLPFISPSQLRSATWCFDS